MTIIIETPAPPTRERLVLVPPDSCTPVFYDGKPAGLSCEGARDATPEDLARAGYVPAFSDLEASRDHYRDAHLHAIARAERAERELSEVRELQRSDERDGNVGFSLTCWVESILEQLNIARINRTELGKAAGRYARERDTARAELARLTAPAEGEPLDEALRDAFEVAYRDAASECHANAIRAIYRLGVAHERARQQPAQDRATDEELERAYSAAYARAWESEVSTPDRGERAGVLAVAAHVRQERCLVARVVSASMSMHVYRRGHDGWAVALGPRFVECERADVPATLARLLGEVER